MTRHSKDAIGAWLDSAGRIPLLDRAETIELARIVHKGATEEERTEAINKLVAANLRLVAKVWQMKFSFVRPSDPRCLDLLQEGAIGLRHGITKFEVERGYTLSTYVVAWIRKGMADYLRDRDRTIRISGDCHRVVQIAQTMMSKSSLDGKTPTLEEIAAVAKKPVSSVAFFLGQYALTQKASLNRQRADEEDASELMDTIPARPSYDLEKDKRADNLRVVLDVIFDRANLTSDERTLIQERLLMSTEPRSFASIGRDLKLAGRVETKFRTALSKCERAVKQEREDFEELLACAA